MCRHVPTVPNGSYAPDFELEPVSPSTPYPALHERTGSKSGYISKEGPPTSIENPASLYLSNYFALNYAAFCGTELPPCGYFNVR